MTPAGVQELTARGHKVLVQQQGGEAIGLSDAEYQAAGAELVASAAEIFARAEMIVKVKEPQPEECELLRPGQLLFTYLHLAPDPVQTQLLVHSGAVAIAYETVTDERGGLPLLAPMSEVAGRMAIQAGAHSLEKAQGVTAPCWAGCPRWRLPRWWCWAAGWSASTRRAWRWDWGRRHHPGSLPAATAGAGQPLRPGPQDPLLHPYQHRGVHCPGRSGDRCRADPGAAAPKLLTRDMLKLMRKGSVLVDVAIDQGGCFETSHPTTHEEPTYVVDGIIHYCVANMPGGVARTSTFALTNATLPFVLALADKGYARALQDDRHLRAGLNVFKGKITQAAVAQALGYEYVSAESVLG